MSRDILDNWIPEDKSGTVLTTIDQTSAVEALASREPMSYDNKTIHRLGGVSVSVVPKGTAYPEDVTPSDEVTMKARKFGTIVRLAEEDLADIPQNVIAQKTNEWAKSYAVELDNACLAVTGEENGTTVPFTSLYRTLATASAPGYTAGANITKSAGEVTYDGLSALLAQVEASNRIGGDVIFIAHPAFKAALRNVKDANGTPLFVQGLAGTPDTVFGNQIVWARGARTSAVATDKPTGNPLLIAVAKEALILGVRSGPEYKIADADSGAAFNTDETLLKMRARRAFVLGHPESASCLELTNA